jgi:beta-glucanase (GH16 family)
MNLLSENVLIGT